MGIKRKVHGTPEGSEQLTFQVWSLLDAFARITLPCMVFPTPPTQTTVFENLIIFGNVPCHTVIGTYKRAVLFPPKLTRLLRRHPRPFRPQSVTGGLAKRATLLFACAR